MENKMFLNAYDLMELTNLKEWRCRKIIKDCNAELKKQGKYTQSNIVSRKAVLAFLGEEE